VKSPDDIPVATKVTSDPIETLATRAGSNALVRDEELPVVARLVVEIRSDGSRTIARGGIEDLQLGQRVTVEARGDSPLQLALALAKSISSLPGLASAKVREAGRLDKIAAKSPTQLMREALSPRKVIRGLLRRKK
jgi:hypothetical protein